MLNTYSQLPQAWCGVFVGSIYAVFMTLLNLTSFLPLLVAPPSEDALGSVDTMRTSPVTWGDTQKPSLKHDSFETEPGGGLLFFFG